MDYLYFGGNPGVRPPAPRNSANGQSRGLTKEGNQETKPNVVVPQPVYDILTSDLPPPGNEEIYGGGDPSYAFLQQLGHPARKDYPYFQVAYRYINDNTL